MDDNKKTIYNFGDHNTVLGWINDVDINNYVTIPAMLEYMNLILDVNSVLMNPEIKRSDNQ